MTHRIIHNIIHTITQHDTQNVTKLYYYYNYNIVLLPKKLTLV